MIGVQKKNKEKLLFVGNIILSTENLFIKLKLGILESINKNNDKYEKVNEKNNSVNEEKKHEKEENNINIKGRRKK